MISAPNERLSLISSCVLKTLQFDIMIKGRPELGVLRANLGEPGIYSPPG